MHIFHRRAGTKPALHSSGKRRRESRLRPASRVVVEELEKRWLMTTTFNAYFAIPAGIQQSQSGGCCIVAYLTTTGGTADHWTIDWNDGHTDTVYPASGSQTALDSHLYQNTSQHYNITAKAYQTATGPATQAVQALTSSFGQSFVGMTIDSPSGGSGDLSGKSMVLDDSGRAYVCTPYSGQIAVTRFTSAGAVDTSWNTTGTWPIPSFDGGSDSPASLYFAAVTISGITTKYLAVAGKGANGFAVALFNISTGLLKWYVPLTGNPAIEGGQANAVYIDRNGDVIAVGKNAGKMVAVKLAGGDNGGTVVSGWGDAGTPGIVTVPHWPNGTSTIGESANAIIEFPSASGVDDLVVGGWESYYYTNNGQCCTACDWAMIVLTDSGGAKDSTNSFGCCHLNYAACAQGNAISGCSSCPAPFHSQDSINAFTIIWDGNLKILPVGSSTYRNEGAPVVAVGCLWGIGTNEGQWDTNYGSPGFSVGLIAGSLGVGYAATLDSSNGTTVAGMTSYLGSSHPPSTFLVDAFTSSGDWKKGSPPLTPGFGNNGVFTTDFGSGSANYTDSANGVAFTPDGNSVIVGGYTIPSGSSYGEIALAEYNATNWLVIKTTLAPSPHALQPTLGGSAIDPMLLPLKRRTRQPSLLSG